MPTLRQLFRVFLKTGTVAFGGAYSLQTSIDGELVEKRKWLGLPVRGSLAHCFSENGRCRMAQGQRDRYQEKRGSAR